MHPHSAVGLLFRVLNSTVNDAPISQDIKAKKPARKACEFPTMAQRDPLPCGLSTVLPVTLLRQWERLYKQTYVLNQSNWQRVAPSLGEKLVGARATWPVLLNQCYGQARQCPCPPMPQEHLCSRSCEYKRKLHNPKVQRKILGQLKCFSLHTVYYYPTFAHTALVNNTVVQHNSRYFTIWCTIGPRQEDKR